MSWTEHDHLIIDTVLHLALRGRFTAGALGPDSDLTDEQRHLVGQAKWFHLAAVRELLALNLDVARGETG